MMPEARLFNTAVLYTRIRSAPPILMVPLLFQVVPAPLSNGVPDSVVVPLVLSVPPPAIVAPPKVRVEPLATDEAPEKESVPPEMVRLSLLATFSA